MNQTIHRLRHDKPCSRYNVDAKRFLLAVLLVLTTHSSSIAQTISFSSPARVAVADTPTALAYNNATYLAANTSGDVTYWMYSKPDSIILLQKRNQQEASKSSVHFGSNIGLTSMAYRSDGSLWAAWSEGPLQQQVIRVKYSTNDGASWKGPYSLSTGGKNSAPCIVTSKTGYVHVVWFCDSANVSKVLYSRYDNASDSFFPSPKRLDVLPGSISSWASLTAYGDTLFATWKDKQSGSFQIYISISTNRGDVWLTPTKISTEGNCGDPSAAFVRPSPSTSILSVAYQHTNKNIGVKRSTNFGQSWLSTQPISSHGLFARIVADESGFVAVNFEYYQRNDLPNTDDTNKDVGLAYSMDFGASFSSDTVAFNHYKLGTSVPTIIHVNDKLYRLAWKQRNGAVSDLLWRDITRQSLSNVFTIQSASEKALTINVYPNPFTDKVTITARWIDERQEETGLEMIQGGYSIRMVDLLGRLVKEIPFEYSQEKNTITLSLHENQGKIFFIQIYRANGFVAQRMVVRE